MTAALRAFALLLAAVLAASLVPARAQSVAAPTARDGHSDFDFLLGTWHTRYRILRKRLSNNHQWYTCSGTSVVRPFWNGFGNLEDGDLRCSGSRIIGMTLRLYNPQTHQWSLWWGTKTRGLVPPPQVGHFGGAVGQFYARDKHEGKPIVVRFKWTVLPGDHPYFEQAYSADDGRTWETNWTCIYTRA